MRVKPGFVLREVCGQNIIIAEGKQNVDFSNIISMNDSSALLWRSVQGKDFTVADLARTLQDHYQLDDDKPLPADVAMKDAEEIARKWLEAGIISQD